MTTRVVEEWATIPGFPKYDVSDRGNVCRYFDGGRRKEVKKHLSAHGYPLVRLCPGRSKDVKSIYVHRLVALVFLGPRPASHDIDHIDGNRTNASLDNLEYVTRSENVKRANARNGRTRARPRSTVRLNQWQVRICRRIRSMGASVTSLARDLGVTPSYLCRVAKGHGWASAGGVA